MTIPIIYFHIGSSQTLPQSISVVRHFNNNAFLLGNLASQPYAIEGGISFVDVADHWDGVPEFAGDFVNMSSNSPNIELICIARWMVIYNFLVSSGFRTALYVDSDVLFFANAGYIYKALFGGHKFTLSHGTSGHTMFLETEFLGKFVEYFTEIYRLKTGIEWENLVFKYQSRQKYGLNGGVCDMTLLRNYSLGENSQYVDEITRIRRLDNKLVSFDDNINSSDSVFVMDDRRIKSIEFDKAGSPTGKRLDYEEPIHFLSLHFQGPAKQYCSEIYNEWSSRVERMPWR